MGRTTKNIIYRQCNPLYGVKDMYYVEVPRYADAKHSVSHYLGERTYPYANLDDARKFAIECINRDQWSRMSAYVSQAFYPNSDVSKFIGGGVKGIAIYKNKEANFYGAVVPNRGKFYWVLNNAQHEKSLLNMYGQVIDLPPRTPKKKNEGAHPFGL